MASLAQMERELTIERTRAGLEVARKRQMTDSKIKSAKKLLASGVPPRDVASNLGVSVPTLYRWISGFHDGLTYDIVRFLKGSLLQIAKLDTSDSNRHD
jgi:DNA invertase Pin-like site-specific DNA recombinase